MDEFDFEDDSETELSLKDFITANPESLIFAGVNDYSVEIIDEENGKIATLEIEKLQWLIQEFVKYRAKDNPDDLDPVNLFD